MTYTINNLQINQERIKNMRKSSLYAFLGSTLSCVLLFLIMWFYVMPFTGITQPVEEEGIMVSFGDNEDAGGMGSSSEPLAAPEEEVLAPVIEQKAAVTSKPVVAEKLITQNDNSNAIYEQKQKDIERKKKEKDLKQQQQIEQQRIDNENRIAQQKKQAQQDAINKVGATMNGVFSNGSKTSGSGDGKGSGNGGSNGSGDGPESGIQGSLFGHGNSNGNNWSLDGRKLIGGIVRPRYESSTIGKITVQIYVDSNGNVTDASIYIPTTISDVEIRNDAIIAAKKVKFTRGDGRKKGIITYNYMNN